MSGCIDDLPERILRRIQFGDDCWLWLGCRNARGYGVTTLGNDRLAHRALYKFLAGDIPSGHHLHHRDSCPHHCVRPSHLTPITPSEHSRLHPHNPQVYWERKRRRSRCIRGHEYTIENTRLKNGHRVCRACDKEIRRASQRAWRQRRTSSLAA